MMPLDEIIALGVVIVFVAFISWGIVTALNVLMSN